MANSLLKLTVESSEYDAKLKKAAEGVRHLADVAHKSAGDMTGLEQSTLDYIKSIGEMETKSRSAAGQVRELESTYKELKVIYDQLNDVEKADEGGKALAASLEQLKLRAQDAKKSLDDATKSLQKNEESSKNDSSSISDLTSKLGINVKSLVGWGAALAAGKMALDVLKDSLFSSESFVDEWGRTVAASEGVYQSFLQSLNTGDFSGFLNNIGQVTQAAREAYNALDELGTRMTIINPERAKLQSEQQRLRGIIRREGANSEAGKKATEQLKKLEPQLSKSYNTESTLNYNAFEKLVRERLAEGGINLNQRSFNDLMKTFSSDAAFQQMRSRAKGSKSIKNYVGAYKEIDNRNTEKKLMDLFTDEWRQQNSAYLTAAFNAKGASFSNMLGNTRYLKGGKTGGGGGGKGGTTTTNVPTYAADSIAAQQALVSELTKKWNEAGASMQQGYLEQLVEAEAKLKQMKADAEWMKDLAMGKFSGQGFSSMGEALESTGMPKPISTQQAPLEARWMSPETLAKANREAQKTPKSKDEEKQVDILGQMNTGLSSIAGGLNQLGIELPEELTKVITGIQAVAAILTGISALVTIITAIQGTKAIPVIGWALAGGGVVHAASGYTVPGNNYSGDMVPAMLNSGELVLNRAQQGNLASQLSDGGLSGLHLELIARGETMRVVLNNNGKRTGRGELLTTNRR